MELITYDDLIEKDNIKGCIVKDIKTGKNAVIYLQNPLIIEFEDGMHRPREIEDLLFYIWSDDDVSLVKKKAKELQEFFNKNKN